MKLCSKCHIEKFETEFFVKDKRGGRLHAQCKQCYKEHRSTYMAEHYIKYGDQYRTRAKVRRLRIRQELQAKMMQFLADKACVECGESDMRVLDFDHIDPSKKLFGIGRGFTNGYRWEDLMIEIKKCRILCANCHRKHTALTQGWYKNE